MVQQFDTSAHLAGLRQLGLAALSAGIEAVQAGGEVAAGPPYTSAEPPETSDLPVDQVLSDVHAAGYVASIDIAVVESWALSMLGDPPGGHCEDCLALAAGGPYAAGTLTTRPRDGTTRCGNACYCEVVQRPATWEAQQDIVFQAMADAIETALGGSI